MAGVARQPSMSARHGGGTFGFKEALYAPLRFIRLTLDLDRTESSDGGADGSVPSSVPSPPAMPSGIAKGLELAADCSLERKVLKNAAKAATAESEAAAARSAAQAKRQRSGPSPQYSSSSSSTGAQRAHFGGPGGSSSDDASMEDPNANANNARANNGDSAARRLSLGAVASGSGLAAGSTLESPRNNGGGGGAASASAASSDSGGASLGPWSCGACTLINAAEDSTCACCGGAKPAVNPSVGGRSAGSAGAGAASDSGPGRPGAGGNSNRALTTAATNWYCELCQAENGPSSSVCHMCSLEARGRGR